MHQLFVDRFRKEDGFKVELNKVTEYYEQVLA